MALTEFQRRVCRVIAAHRRAAGESYVAGGTALNASIGALRVSRDVDLFHDREEALRAAWDADRAALGQGGFGIEVVRERPTFVEAVVRAGDDALLLQWALDSAYRFFPLLEHPDFGLVLHPLDLATNKVLALVGRMEPRDWVDTIETAERLQPLGYLVWAACGKDPAFNPSFVLAEAGRSTRYVDADLAALEFEGERPTASSLATRFRAQLEEADRVVAKLPVSEAGKCVLAFDGSPYRGPAAGLERALERGEVVFHEGRLRGAYPTMRPFGG